MFIKRKIPHCKEDRIQNRPRSNSDAYSNSSSENTSTENENDSLYIHKFNNNNTIDFLAPNSIHSNSTCYSSETKFFNALR